MWNTTATPALHTVQLHAHQLLFGHQQEGGVGLQVHSLRLFHRIQAPAQSGSGQPAQGKQRPTATAPIDGPHD